MPESHTVKQGDTLGGIARAHGFASWREIYDDDNNAELRRLRPNPALLYPGDTVVLPERRAEPRPLPTQKKNRFVARTPPRILRLVVRGPDGEPLAGSRYELRAIPRSLEGTIPASGEIEHAVPADLESVDLFVWGSGAERPSFQWTLRLGHLDPIDTVSGIQARLNNLGYDAGPADGIDGPLTRAALRAFQEHHDLPTTGEPDDTVRAKLAEAYGC